MSDFKKILKRGLPFLSFMALGAYFLREFTSIRYEMHSYRTRYHGLGQDDLKMTDFQDDDDDDDGETREEEERREQEDIAGLQNLGVNDTWKNIRGPRPWEEPSEDYKTLLQTLKERNEQQFKSTSGTASRY